MNINLSFDNLSFELRLSWRWASSGAHLLIAYYDLHLSHCLLSWSILAQQLVTKIALILFFGILFRNCCRFPCKIVSYRIQVTLEFSVTLLGHSFFLVGVWILKLSTFTLFPEHITEILFSYLWNVFNHKIIGRMSMMETKFLIGTSKAREWLHKLHRRISWLNRFVHFSSLLHLIQEVGHRDVLSKSNCFF